MYLYGVTLFYHPSGDNMDPGSDFEKKPFLLNETALDDETILSMVVEKINGPAHYGHEIDFINLSWATLEQVTALLKAVGLKVFE